MSYTPSKQALLAQLERIHKSNVVGRSSNLNKLLDYLVDKQLSKNDRKSQVEHNPKETEIAIEVFGKTTEFNTAEDSSVRVHISRLRKKLEEYYQSEGKNEAFIISIPVGEYRLAFAENSLAQTRALDGSEKTLNSHALINRKTLILMAVLCLLSVSLHGFFYYQTPNQSLASSPAHVSNKVKPAPHFLWQDFIQFPRRTLIVLGAPSLSEPNRDEVATWVKPDHQLNISKNQILALKSLLSLTDDFRYTPIVYAEDLTPNDLKQKNVVYIGHFANMGILQNYFNGSHFSYRVEQTALVSKASQEQYVAPNTDSEQYVDYGLFAKLDGPRHSKLYIISGFTDSALLWLSWFATSNKADAQKEFGHYIGDYELDNGDNFELLFKIPSLQGTDMGYEIVAQSKVDSHAVWHKMQQ
ncbi:hypothetical protein C2869_04060 [Saccharobesus litoralis]|uniref:Uncharacterized protein n=1 Tax=Saccharobesus litoralis TaxID=2172099 RepID=A0A2S0VN63_9ALTE|nr:winged helix-turn-helix domain-containing protein [Saccharobesus litoralis]AWB65661.1 hypothetical protein C2869_04060 [Saccharobesus litoralis]